MLAMTMTALAFIACDSGRDEPRSMGGDAGGGPVREGGPSGGSEGGGGAAGGAAGLGGHTGGFGGNETPFGGSGGSVIGGAGGQPSAAGGAGGAKASGGQGEEASGGQPMTNHDPLVALPAPCGMLMQTREGRLACAASLPPNTGYRQDAGNDFHAVSVVENGQTRIDFTGRILVVMRPSDPNDPERLSRSIKIFADDGLAGDYAACPGSKVLAGAAFARFSLDSRRGSVFNSPAFSTDTLDVCGHFQDVDVKVAQASTSERRFRVTATFLLKRADDDDYGSRSRYYLNIDLCPSADSMELLAPCRP